MINMFPHPPLQLPDAPTQQWVKCLMTLTFDILTLKVVSESRVKWAISVPNLVFLGLCSQLRPDVRDRHQTSDKSITVTNCRRVAATICIHPSPSQWAPKRLSWLSIISTVLCQKGLSDIFCHFLLFRDYDTTANNTSPVKILEASCAWKWCFLTFKCFSERI